MTRIPILNIYYLLCYAWDHVQERDPIRLATLAELSTSQDLLGKVLASGVNHLIRRGMDRGYLERREDLAGIRGKLAVGDTVKRALKARARAACDFEELSVDILRNRILRASLRRLQDVSRNDLTGVIRNDVRSAYRKMPDVSSLRLTRGSFTRVQLAGGNRRLYRFLLSVCWLIHENLILDEQTGQSVFYDFRRNEKTMWKLFEDFAIGFYRRERRDFSLRGRRISWTGMECTTAADRELIPDMYADLILESKARRSGAPARRIILDTKFYKEVLPGGKLNSRHLYQLLAYLRNRQARYPGEPRHDGILLYAQSGEQVRVNICLEGFRIQACTVDLNREWREIHREMLAILDPPTTCTTDGTAVSRTRVRPTEN